MFQVNVRLARDGRTDGQTGYNTKRGPLRRATL